MELASAASATSISAPAAFSSSFLPNSLLYKLMFG